MASLGILKSERKTITQLVQAYVQNREDVFETFLNSFIPVLRGNNELSKLVHSIKWRTKDPKSLKDKLERKFVDYKRLHKKNEINRDNLFTKINDLAGVRILHLHTDQFSQINDILLKIFKDLKFKIIEGPEARVWDDEYRSFFKSIGIKIKAEKSKSLYSSIHYVLDTQRQTHFTFEIQVRTLADEIWGEVDHKINYPHQTKNAACREQIQVLARMTSGCTRLVDSIFFTFNDKKTKKKR